MRTLSAAEILGVWERGQHQHPLDRAITLLAVTCPEKSREELIKLSMGQRDTLLFSLRQFSLGPKLETYAECPACGAALELNINTEEILQSAAGTGKTEWIESIGEYIIRYRLPDSADLAGCINVTVQDKPGLLLKRCILSIARGGEEIDFTSLNEKVRSELNSRMAAIDPLSEVQIALTCIECGHHWTELLDIFSFFWIELGMQVTQLLSQVHTLARAYSWSEKEILSLSPWRRQYYLNMVTS
jgi:hypothetical protein